MDKQLQRLIAEVLEIPADHVRPELQREEIPEWDSLNHLRLITAIESELGVSFTMEQIVAISSVADLEAATRRDGRPRTERTTG